jgi:hypothetical protein
VEESGKNVQASLTDILAEPHGLDSHKSAGDIRFYIVNMRKDNPWTYSRPSARS